MAAEGNTMRIMFFVRSLLFVMGMLAVSAVSFAQVRVGVAITIAPPELPVYEQPICPGDGYIWTPGYWAYGDDDYYWVPGTWVLAPEVGFLWTPSYWGWVDGGYVFYDGYWGPQVGFYGGINYGFGYFGHGFEGGRWDHDHFFYNRAVANVNVTVIHNVYETRVNNTTVTRVSFNGGNGGINERPTSQEEAAAHERHIAPVAAQTEHVQAARANTELRASSNHGKPPVAATSKPGDFRGGGVVAAREGGAVHGSPARPENNATRPENNAARPATPIHPKDLPPAERPASPNTGNAKQDQKYQQQQEKLQQKQEQEHQKLQQKQDQDHQRLEQQKANDARKQQMEQQHQRQTQQLEQKHTQQQQKMQQRQQPPARPSQTRPPKP
jgi:hypothetical protein